MLAACATAYDLPRDPGRARGGAAVSEGGSEAGLRRLIADMDPAMRTLARRHDPDPRTDFWGRPVGWETYRIDEVPTLGFDEPQGVDAATAEEINALRPFARLPIRPMRPFVLKTDSIDQARAVQCLSQAVYFEAGRESLAGQEAVAQIVLNRLRHPAYPKSVCGVVYQGSARKTGCQFTFTCDGSLAYAPEPGRWRQAQDVARRALAGFVLKDVGSATHYHAAYVAPYWAPTLVKMKQIGAHIFYRWTGPWGEPGAFTGRYGGGEAELTEAVLQGADPRTAGLFDPEGRGMGGGRKVTLAVAGEVRTYTVADASASGGLRTRVLGSIQPARRQPTPDEIARINKSLAQVEAGLETAAAAAAAVDAGAGGFVDPLDR